MSDVFEGTLETSSKLATSPNSILFYSLPTHKIPCWHSLWHTSSTWVVDLQLTVIAVWEAGELLCCVQYAAAPFWNCSVASSSMYTDDTDWNILYNMLRNNAYDAIWRHAWWEMMESANDARCHFSIIIWSNLGLIIRNHHYFCSSLAFITQTNYDIN